MDPPPALLVAPCAHDAARAAVMAWHYSRAMPSSRLVTHGAWEHGRFVGAVVFGRGATPHLLDPYGLTQAHGCELVRVALAPIGPGTRTAHTSAIVARSVRLLRTDNPGLRLIVSFADPHHGHHGAIYQAMNWTYLGASAPARFFVINGRVTHPRTVGSSGWRQSVPWLRAHVDPTARTVIRPGKHRYAMPLDRAMRRAIAPHARPYPPPEPVDGAPAATTPPNERPDRLLYTGSGND